MLAIFFNTFINPIALESIGWKYYIVFIVVLVIFGFTAYFFYPETRQETIIPRDGIYGLIVITRGHSLEQMAVIFDGDNAEVAPSAETSMSTSISSVDAKKANNATSHIEEKFVE